MRLSTKGEYACLALVELSQSYNDGYVKIEEISKKYNIPKKFLSQILLILNRSGYLNSRRGTEGGYKLSKSPEKITLAEVIRLLDGPLAPVGSVSEHFYKNTPIEKNANLKNTFKEIRDFIAEKLERTTLADLL